MPDRNQDLIGRHYGHLTVIAKSDQRGTQNEYKWICQCDCGKRVLETTSALNSGQAISCGHVRLEKSKKNLQYTEHRHMTMLNNRKPKNNRTGYKNISMTRRNGRLRYRVSVQYNHVAHQKLADSLEDALAIREQLRKTYWPNYKK